VLERDNSSANKDVTGNGGSRPSRLSLDEIDALSSTSHTLPGGDIVREDMAYPAADYNEEHMRHQSDIRNEDS